MSIEEYVDEIIGQLRRCGLDRDAALRVLRDADANLRESAISQQGQENFWYELSSRVQLLLEKQAASALSVIAASIQAAIGAYQARIADRK